MRLKKCGAAAFRTRAGRVERDEDNERREHPGGGRTRGGVLGRYDVIFWHRAERNGDESCTVKVCECGTCEESIGSWYTVCICVPSIVTVSVRMQLSIAARH